MCGIVGYIGKGYALEVLLNGLSKLEYRGYDSAGIGLHVDAKVEVYKEQGKLVNLRNSISSKYERLAKSHLGIGHIRWATHGVPNVLNAHPHQCNCGKLAVVHNGIIENFKELKAELQGKGCRFKSQTDTEVVAHLIAHEYAKVKNLTEAVCLATERIEGSYALCIIHQDVKDTMVVTRRNAPLLIGVGGQPSL